MTQIANPLNITDIDHVVIRVLDMPEMINFYCRVLGCKLERGPGTFGIAQLRAGNALIDLLDANSEFGREGGGHPDHSNPTVDHVCLRIMPWDTKTVTDHLKAHGVAHGPVDDRYGARGAGPSLYLRDPEGNSIELKG